MCPQADIFYYYHTHKYLKLFNVNAWHAFSSIIDGCTHISVGLSVLGQQ